MKRFSRCICAIMAVVLLLAVPVHAEEAAPRASSFFGSYSTYLYKAAYNKIEVWFDVVALGAMDELGVSSIKVQRSADGSNWETMRVYEPGVYTHMICENTGFHCDYVTYTGTPGYYYRAYVTFYARNSTGYGKRYVYTQTMLL